MLDLSFTTGNEVIDILSSRFIMLIIGYVLVNICVMGFKGFYGGFLPIKVTLSVGSFYTSRRNAYNSERLTRIVQHRYCGGNPLPNKLREEVLALYGPSSQRKRPRHYRNVEVNAEYKSKTTEP